MLRLDEFRLKHLRMLVALQEHGKVAIVAEMFRITQPALSRMFSELEDRAGFQLFERHNRGTSLTAAGALLAAHARMVLSSTSRIEHEMEMVATGQRGSVSIGTIMTPATDFVAPALTNLFREHNDIDVSINVGSSDVLLAQLERGELDFVICRFAQGVDVSLFNYAPLGLESLRLVVAVESPLAQLDTVSTKDLIDLDWVLQPSGSFLRQVVDGFHIRHGIRPKSVVSTSSILLTLLLARSSGRMGIFAQTTADLFDRSGLVKSLAMTAEIEVPGFGLISLKSRELSTSAKKLYRSFTTLIGQQETDETAPHKSQF